MRKTIQTLLAAILLSGQQAVAADEQGGPLVRIAEIEIDPKYQAEYLSALREGAETAIRLEPGVVAILPLFQKSAPAQFRILEIYESREAYDAHIRTPHFLKYKTTTLDMVKSLRLVDMQVLDEQIAAQLITRWKRRK
ncbi:MAG: hypothetical protein RLZZ200_1915 [Pseudomonadota bacterium]